MSKEKKLSIGLLLIIFGIILVSTSSDYLKTLAIFLLVLGGGFFGSSISIKN